MPGFPGRTEFPFVSTCVTKPISARKSFPLKVFRVAAFHSNRILKFETGHPIHRLGLALIIVSYFWGIAKSQAQVQPSPTTRSLDTFLFVRDRSQAAAEDRQRRLLATRIAELNALCKLSSAQKQKLELAGKGDIKRYFDKVARFKQELELRLEPPTRNELSESTSGLRFVLSSGLFLDGSLIARTISNTFTTEQLAVYDARVLANIRTGHEAAIKDLIVLLEPNSARDAHVWTAFQKQQFGEFVNSEIEPTRCEGPYRVHYLVVRLGHVDPARLKEFLPEITYRQLRRSCEELKEFEPILREAGYFQEKDDG